MNNNKIKGFSIRTKIIVAMVCLSILSLVTVSSIIGFQIHKELKIEKAQNWHIV